MKKLALATAAGLLALNAHAQYADIGVHGGFGTTWFINNNISDQGSNLDPEFSTAPVFGIHFNYSLSKTIGIKTEVNYAVINQKFKGEENNVSWTGKDRTNYVELPVLLMLKANAFYCEIGPKFSFITGATTSMTVNNFPSSSYSDKPAMSSYKNAVVSAVLGLGGNFRVGNGWYLNAGLRFSWGLTDATQNMGSENPVVPETPSITYAGAQFDQSGKQSYEKTHIATGHIILGISRRFPY